MGNLKIDGNLMLSKADTRLMLGKKNTNDYIDLVIYRGTNDNQMYICGNSGGDGGHIGVGTSSSTKNAIHIGWDSTDFIKPLYSEGSLVLTAANLYKATYQKHIFSAGAGWRPIAYIENESESYIRGVTEFWVYTEGGSDAPSSCKITLDMSWGSSINGIHLEGDAIIIGGCRIKQHTRWTLIELNFNHSVSVGYVIYNMESLNHHNRAQRWTWYDQELYPAENFPGAIVSTTPHHYGYSTTYQLSGQGLRLKSYDISTIIESLNDGYVHFQNDKGVPWYFNADIRVDGNIYAGNGYNDLVLTTANFWTNVSALKEGVSAGYSGIIPVNGDANWIRTPPSGLIPYEKGTAGNGHSYLGTDSWYFKYGYIDHIYGRLHGHADCATHLYSANSQYAYGSTNPYFMYMTYNDPYWDLKVSPATPENVRVSRAHSATNADWAAGSTYSLCVAGTYTGAGGQQGPNYIGRAQVRFNMMDGFPGVLSCNYMDVMLMDTYGGGDVPRATAFGIERYTGRAFVAEGGDTNSTWARCYELISTKNIGDQNVYSSTFSKYITASHVYQNNGAMSNSTTAETLFANGSIMSCGFMAGHPVWGNYADVLYFSGYDKWGGTQMAFNYNAGDYPTMAIRKYTQSGSTWGNWNVVLMTNCGSSPPSTTTPGYGIYGYVYYQV